VHPPAAQDVTELHRRTVAPPIEYPEDSRETLREIRQQGEYLGERARRSGARPLA